MGIIEEYLGERIGRLFSWIGLPGWVFILLGILWEIFVWVPELHHAVEFWAGAAEGVGSHMPQIAAALTSPWFGSVLVVLGVGYLVFVGEPRWQIRHPLAPYLGWAIVGVVVLVLWSVLVAGYVAVHLPAREVQTVTRVEPPPVEGKVEQQERSVLPRPRMVGPYHYRNEMTVEETMKTVRGLSNLFKDARSLTFVITGHPDNESFRTDFYSLIVAACQSAEIAGNSPCSIENAPDPQREVDVDIPTPKYPGIVIHHEPISPGDQTGLDSMHILGIGRFVVRKSSHVPEAIATLNRNHQPHFYWFELGPGCPWNDPDICAR